MKLLSFLLSLNMMVSTTGVYIHSHWCMQEDIQTGELVLQNCHQVESEKSCCSTTSMCGDEEDSCCTVEDNFYKEDMDARVSDVQPSLMTVAMLPVIIIHMTPVPDEQDTDFLRKATSDQKHASDQAVLQVFRC